MDVALIRLVSAPCNSPCSLDGIFLVMMDCKAGPQIPPRQYGTVNTSIIQPSDAKAYSNIPIAYSNNPYKTLF